MAEEQAGACPSVSEVCEAHERFEPFVGIFKAEVKLWMGPGDPKVMTGTMKNSLDLGGRYLRHDYEGKGAEGPFAHFAGRGFWGFNTVTRKYEGFWIDTASTFMMTETGDVDDSGKVWNMEGEIINPETMKPMRKRSVIKLQDHDHHSMEMYFTAPDGSEFKSMEVQYERA